MSFNLEVSDRAKEIIKSFMDSNSKIERPSWDKIYLEMSFSVAKRSHDAQTKCGAVIVNRDNEIVSTGYNGFFRGAYDEMLPNTRPLKYPFMIHAEHNAILNCARQGRSTKNCTAYITGEPCNNCLMLLIQAGISEVVFSNVNKAVMTSSDPDYKAMREVILLASGYSIKLREVEYEPNPKA
jgi:dCMP deaminase